MDVPMYVKKSCQNDIRTKNSRSFNVDEIDGRRLNVLILLFHSNMVENPCFSLLRWEKGAFRIFLSSITHSSTPLDNYIISKKNLSLLESISPRIWDHLLCLFIKLMKTMFAKNFDSSIPIKCFGFNFGLFWSFFVWRSVSCTQMTQIWVGH
jgi:hypothetical protein